MYTISINLRPYLRDFLIARYGEEPIRLPKQSTESMTLYDLLNRPPAGRINQGNTTFELPFNRIANVRKDPRVYNYLSDNSINTFETLIYNEFWSTFRDEMRRAKQAYPAIQYKQAIRMFMEKYNLHPDNIEYDTLKKHDYRFREKRLKNIKNCFAILA